MLLLGTMLSCIVSLAEQSCPTLLCWHDGQHFAQALIARQGLSFLRRRQATSGSVNSAIPAG